MTIKTFRGLIADGAQDTVVLHTNDGSTGYRIKNFQVMSAAPGTTAAEWVMKIYKISQTTIDGAVDFSENTLLGSAFLAHDNAPHYSNVEIIIFDSEIFNQDIYITCFDANAATSNPCNYYLELEQVKLDLNENTVATLKDIRNSTAPITS